LFSQTKNDVSKEIWIDFTPSYYFNPGFQLLGEIGFWHNFKENGWTKLAFKPYIRTWLGSKFNLFLGIGNYYAHIQNYDDRLEIRPFQGISTKWPKWEIPIYHYLRLEERFDFNTKTWKSDNSLRLRYSLSGTYKFNKQQDKYWEALLKTEVFINFAKEKNKLNEEFRFTVGLDRGFSYVSHVRFELTWQKETFFKNDISVIYFHLSWYRSWSKF
jgi:hypothetical protein